MSEQQVLPEFIATLKAAAEKATPGPWHWGIHDYSMASLTGELEEEEHVISVSPCDSCQATIAEPKEWKFGRCTTPTESNADYIAAASPDVILKLLASLAQSEAERERLQGSNEWLNGEFASAVELAGNWKAQALRMEAELARVREELEYTQNRRNWLNDQMKMHKEIADNQTFHVTELRAELARERERHQELREVLVGMRSVIDGAGDIGFFDTDRAASLVIKADFLLESAPVATGEGQ